MVLRNFISSQILLSLKAKLHFNVIVKQLQLLCIGKPSGLTQVLKFLQLNELVRISRATVTDHTQALSLFQASGKM